MSTTKSNLCSATDSLQLLFYVLVCVSFLLYTFEHCLSSFAVCVIQDAGLQHALLLLLRRAAGVKKHPAVTAAATRADTADTAAEHTAGAVDDLSEQEWLLELAAGLSNQVQKSTCRPPLSLILLFDSLMPKWVWYCWCHDFDDTTLSNGVTVLLLWCAISL